MANKKGKSAAEILMELLADNDEIELHGVRLEAEDEPIVLEFDQSALAGGGGGVSPAIIAQAVNQTIQRMMSQAPAIAMQTMADFGLVSPEAVAAYGGISAPAVQPGLPPALTPATFEDAKPQWPNKIAEIQFGAS
ncbi:MAG: hypothetical protein ACXAEI_08375, partial [Candidatus Hodarchaeales archaeon]